MSGSSASWCKETDKKINYTKLCRLLVDGGTQAVRSVFDGIHPPSSLKAILNANKTTLQKLKKPKGKVLNNEQWDKLYPPSGSSPKSQDFDITLLFVLLRNICRLTAPATGWDGLPPVTDNSLEANLARIKYYRNNKIAHKPNTEINDDDFEQHWQVISSALLSLRLSQDDIDDLKSDPLGKKDYNQLLNDWYISDKDIKTQLVEVKLDTAAIKSDTAGLKSDTTAIKSDTGGLKSDTTAIKSDTTAIKSDTTAIKSDTALLPSIRQDISQFIQKNTICSNSNLKDSLINELTNSEFSSLIGSLCKSFHLNTRQWVLDEVKSHILGGQSEQGEMVITAGPGMGKSTLAAKICQTYKNKGCLAGCHFFQFSNSTRNNPRLMLQSIARQMCDTITGYQGALERKLQTNLGKDINDMDCEGLFTVLLEEPCHKLEVEGSFVVVLDAIDECCSKLKHELQDILKNKLSLLPSWLRLVITTRPPPSFNALEAKKSIFIDPTDPKNQRDIEIFFIANLKYNDDQSRVTKELVKVSGGLFLVAFFLIDEMQKERISSPSELMGIFPHGLSWVYEKYFERLRTVLLPYITEEEGFFRMLKAVVASKDPIPIDMMYSIIGLKSATEVSRRERKARNDALSQLHSLFPVENDHVSVFHKSVVDFLILEESEQDFNTSVGKMCKKSLQGVSEVSDSSIHLECKSLGARNEKRDQNKPLNTVCTDKPPKDHDFSVRVDDGNKVLANQCYDVLSDIRNGKKDLNKPLNLTDSEKYALEFGIQYIIDSCAFSKDKKMEVLMNCFIICSALLTYNCLNREIYSVPFKSKSSHFDDSKEVPKVFHYGKFGGTLHDSHVKPCSFSLPLNFIQCVGFFLQAVKAIGLNEDELSPNPKNLIKEYRLPFLSCNHIASIPDEGFLGRTSVIDFIPGTQLSIAPSKDGIMVVKFNKRQTLVYKYNEDGTCLIEKTFPGLKKMCITPDQRFIVATEVDKRGEVEIINAISLELVKKYQSPNVVKSCHVFGDQPWYIVARCYNNKIYVMEGETEKIHTTFDVENDEEVEAVSSSGHIALSKTWVSTRVRNLTLFTDDDGNFLGEMVWGKTQLTDERSSSTYRKLFLLNALKPCSERVYFYPRREDTYPCSNTYMDNLFYQDQAIAFSQDGVLLAYHYKESIFIVKSEDGSLLKRVHVDNGVGDIIQLSHSHIIFRNSGTIFIIDVTTNEIKHALYLPGNPRKVYVVPRQQEKPLAIIVKNDNINEMQEKPSMKRYSIFRYVFHNLDL